MLIFIIKSSSKLRSFTYVKNPQAVFTVSMLHDIYDTGHAPTKERNGYQSVTICCKKKDSFNWKNSWDYNLTPEIQMGKKKKMEILCLILPTWL